MKKNLALNDPSLLTLSENELSDKSCDPDFCLPDLPENSTIKELEEQYAYKLHSDMKMEDYNALHWAVSLHADRNW